jgi:hypothetical protein
MIALEQTKNDFCSAHLVEPNPAARSLAIGPAGSQGDVEKPGGLFNTSDDPRVGGSVEKPGGLFNTSLSEAPAEAPQEEEPAYIPRVISPGPYSRGGRPKVLTPQVKEELCKLLSIGLSRRQAASWLDIDHSTISHMASRDEDFARSITRAEELASVQPMMVMAAAARKNWRAAAWMLTHNLKRPPVLTEEEKNQLVDVRVANTRREMEYQQRVKILEEEAREAERERKRAKNEAWDRAMLAKERAEREERRRRKAERLQKEAEQAR